MQQQIIPLFPLSIVVFPGHLVPLHIFEERYKKMIADCAGAGGPYRQFGISYNTWCKVRSGNPIRRSVADRLEARIRPRCRVG